MEPVVFAALVIGLLVVYALVVVNGFAALPIQILAAGREASRFAGLFPAGSAAPGAPSAGKPAALDKPLARAA